MKLNFGTQLGNDKLAELAATLSRPVATEKTTMTRITGELSNQDRKVY